MSRGFEAVTVPVRPLITMLLVGAMALSGCTRGETTDPYDDPYAYSVPQNTSPRPSPTPSPKITAYPAAGMHGLKSCFPNTIAEVPRAEHDEWASPLVIERDKATDSAIGDPGPLSADIEKRVRGALVEVIDPDETAPASGVLIAPDVVVTALHTIDSEKTVFKDAKGRTATIKSGCYLYQRNGEVHDPNAAKIATVDLAIVKLTRSIGSSTLQLGAAPKRGQWVTFVNVQAGATAANPRVYNGLAATVDGNSQGATVIAGLARRGSNDLATYTAMGGCSGGPVVDRKGRLVGISYASISDISDEYFQSRLGINYGLEFNDPNFPGASPEALGWRADPASIITPPAIRTALNSMAWR